jgi:hypothetical protein
MAVDRPVSGTTEHAGRLGVGSHVHHGPSRPTGSQPGSWHSRRGRGPPPADRGLGGQPTPGADIGRVGSTGIGMPRRDAGGRMLIRGRKFGPAVRPADLRPPGRPGRLPMRLPVPACHACPSGTLTPRRYQITDRIRASGSLWCSPDHHDAAQYPGPRRVPRAQVCPVSRAGWSGPARCRKSRPTRWARCPRAAARRRRSG